MKEIEYKTYHSRLNKMKPVDVPKEPEKFEILESSINSEFNIGAFIAYINEELEYQGLSVEKLALDCYIKPERMFYILSRRYEIKEEEIKAIKKRLNID